MPQCQLLEDFCLHAQLVGFLEHLVGSHGNKECWTRQIVGSDQALLFLTFSRTLSRDPRFASV